MCDTFAALQQVFIISTKRNQQLHIRIIRVAHHLDNRRVNRRMIAQEIRASIVGGEHDRIAIGR